MSAIGSFALTSAWTLSQINLFNRKITNALASLIRMHLCLSLFSLSSLCLYHYRH